ncbi:MAG TPA: hypothetical protein VJM33_01220 [Microthrixaceae bacterium]|nr:hypothetical protein [Microthrixaceae bacterium]
MIRTRGMRRAAVAGIVVAMAVVGGCAPTPGTVPIVQNGVISYDMWQDGSPVGSGAGPAGIDTWFQQSVWQEGDDQLRWMVTYMNTYPPFSGEPGWYRVDLLIRDLGCAFCGTEVEGATVWSPDGTEYALDESTFEYSIVTEPTAHCDDGTVGLEQVEGEVTGAPGAEVRFAWGRC